MSTWVCEDCGWQWPLKDAPYQDAECDACGGEMHPVPTAQDGTPGSGPAAGTGPIPGMAQAYAASHPVLCAHASDSHGAHWLAPGEKCAHGPVAVGEKSDTEGRRR